MYRLEWIEQLKLGRRARNPAAVRAPISPVVLSLGFTSLLTDISSEMVNSVLPVYLVLHLHLSPLQYGVVDGIYNGFAIALLSLAAGYLADRANRQKQVALAGYGLSAICKLLLLAVGTGWGWILLIIGIDRAGKGIRAAPRDALISLNTAVPSLAHAFSVHRAMDACGSLLGPIAAFVLLAQLPGAFDAVWVASFIFAVLGVSVLWLFVPKTAAPPAPVTDAARDPIPAAAPEVATGGVPERWSPWQSRRFVALIGCGTLLALTAISDGFLYLMMQEKFAMPTGFFPLLYVLTAGAYMLLSIPIGRVADQVGRPLVFACGYAVLAAMYALLLSLDTLGLATLITCLCLLGLYYAATEGVLMAMASATIPRARRTSGIALIATSIGLAKLASSVLFGWLWQTLGMRYAVTTFIIALGAALLASLLWLRATQTEELA